METPTNASIRRNAAPVDVVLASGQTEDWSGVRTISSRIISLTGSSRLRASTGVVRLDRVRIRLKDGLEAPSGVFEDVEFIAEDATSGIVISGGSLSFVRCRFTGFVGPVVRVDAESAVQRGVCPELIDRRYVPHLSAGITATRLDIHFEDCRIGRCTQKEAPVVLAISRRDATTLPLLRGCVFECCTRPKSPQAFCRGDVGFGLPITATHQLCTYSVDTPQPGAPKCLDSVSARFFEARNRYYLEVVRFVPHFAPQA